MVETFNIQIHILNHVMTLFCIQIEVSKPPVLYEFNQSIVTF